MRTLIKWRLNDESDARAPAWRQQALINAVAAAQGAAAQRDRQAANGSWIPAATPKGSKFFGGATMISFVAALLWLTAPAFF
jgi:hypothetical protein